MTAAFNDFHSGPRVNKTFRRDPLAVQFDRSADALIKRAIDARGAWVPTLVHTPEGQLGDKDQDGLTHHERAFLQACYYHRLIYLWGETVDGQRMQNPHRRYALIRRWDEGRTARGRYGGRVLRVRVTRVGEASVYAYDHGRTT